MHAYLADTDPSHPALTLPPVLVAGSNSRACDRAVRTIEAAGLRVADTVSLNDAAERIARQVAASAVWIEIDGDVPPDFSRLFDQVRSGVESARYAAILSVPVAQIDELSAQVTDPNLDVVIDGNDAERAAVLATAIARNGPVQRVSDVASERNAARLRQLSDEVSRIASTLSRMSAAPNAAHQLPDDKSSAGPAPDVSADVVRSIIRARRLRSRFFPEDLFADPAWDMLLDLLQAEIAQLRVPVSSLCIAAAVPATTALRWLKTMTQEGLFVRRADPHDGRRVFVELAPRTSQALRRYFAEVGTPAVV